MPLRHHRSIRALVGLIAIASSTIASAPARATCTDSLRYQTNFDAFADGMLPDSPSPLQDQWYTTLRTPTATAAIQNVVANGGKALFLEAPLANGTGQQTIAVRDIAPGDLASCPTIVLSFDFRCATSSLSATNNYTARLAVVGGPHPGYVISDIQLGSGNGTPRSLGINVIVGAFDSLAQNGFVVPLTVGRNLPWNTWHHVQLMIDQANDRLLQISVNGALQDLRGYAPSRSCDGGQCLRGQLAERVQAEIVPNDDPTETVDGVYFDNVSFSTLSPIPPSPDCPVADPVLVTGNGQVQLTWRRETAPGFTKYSIYRSTSPFLQTFPLTPIATRLTASDTSYLDTGLTNGVAYFYAVTSSVTGRPGCGPVFSLGARRPRDESDLQVITISRQPRYPRFDPAYTSVTVTEPSGFGPYIFNYSTGLGGGQTPATQRWPAVGAPVSYVATIRNRGTNPAPSAVHGRWSVDGVTVSSPILPALAAGARTTSTYVRAWDGASHRIEFTILDPDARAANNTLAIDTRSVEFYACLDRSYIEDFRDALSPQYALAATDDIFDWINRHMARFNQLFAAAGTGKRVHYGALDEVRDGDPDPSVNGIDFAIFPFRFHRGQDDYRAGSAYYHADEDIDYGYLHEMGHQLGLIDIYQMSVSADRNAVSGREYVPSNELMFNSSPLIGPSTATAMTHWLETAQGYFGQYLYAIPRRVIVQFLGNDGQPLANTPVKLHQYCDRPGLGTVLTTQVKASGTTDPTGRWELPNVAIQPGLVPPTYVGDTLRANPWGYVSMLGSNGTLHFDLAVNGVHDYAWLDITEANVAYYSGQRDSVKFIRSLDAIRTTGVDGGSTGGGLSLRFANPYRPGGAISLDSDIPGDAEVGIYDLAGRRVALLMRGPLRPSTARLTWDGGRAAGRKAAGVYFLVARQEDRETRRRLVLLP